MRLALLLVAASSVAYADPRPPSVTIETPSVGAGLTEPMVTRYLKRQRAKFLYCYEKELLATPTLAGPVRAEFDIDAGGRVVNPNTSGVSADVSKCDESVLARVLFPEPTTPKVHVVFVLRHDPGLP